MRKLFTQFGFASVFVSASLMMQAQCGTSALVGSATNMFTQIRNGTNPVAADKNLNTVVFVHRNNTATFGGSSGTIRYDLSTNGGSTWTNNQGLLNPTQTTARYPNVTIYNPTGNTTPTNAYLGYMAPTTGTTWNGVVTGVRQLSGTGNTENLNQPASSQFLIPNSLVKGAPGVFWSVDGLYNGTVVTGFRIYKGTWNTSINDIQWVTNYTMSPTFNTAYDGAAHIGDYNIAFDPTGTYGWVSILTHITPGPTNYAYYPVFYKTIDGGNTWTGPIQVNLTQIPCMTSILTGTNVISTAFEHDLTVDVKGNPHLITAICNGNNAYAVYFGSTHRMFDITQMGGVWTGYDISNVNAGRGTWGTGTNSVTMDMAPQAGRSADGQKVFFTWSDNTTYTVGAANQSPNLFSRAFDVVANKWTNIKDFTSCNAAINGKVYFPHLAAEVLEPTTSSYKLPIVYGEYSTAANDPGIAANFRFLDNATFAAADFTVNQPTVAVSINEGMNWLLCPGYSKTLTITGAYTQVNWTNGSTTNTSVVNTTGTHFVGVRNGCALGIDTFYVTGLANNPVATSPSICIGNSSTLTVTGNAYGYTFTPMNVSGTVTVVSPTATSIYSVTGMGDGACLNTKTVQVTVNPLPVVSISGNNNVCIGSSVVQTASGASTYTWNTGPVTASVSLSPTVNTSYTVTATDVNGCVNSASKTITVNPLPTITMTGTNQVCAGSSWSLTAGGGVTYTWSTGSNSATIVQTPTAATAGNITVSGTDANGCINATGTNYTVFALPTPTAAANPACIGDAIIFGGTSAVTYTWTGPAAFTSNLATPTISPASLMNAGNYTYGITDVNGCSGLTTMNATVNPLPSVSIAGSSTVCGGSVLTQTASGATTYTWSTGATTNPVNLTPLVSAGYTVTGEDMNGCTNTATTFITVFDPPSIVITGNNPICIGATSTQSVSGANTYTWSTSATTSTIAVSPTVATTYTVIGEDVFGCTNTGSVSIMVNALPTLTISGANTICNGTSVTQTVTGASTYTWSTGANSSTVVLTPTANATYTVDGTDVNGCSNNAVVSVSVNALPSVSANTSNSLICPFNSVSLTGSGASTYTWNPGNINGAVISVTPNVTTTYTVTGTDANGCENMAVLTQSVATCTGIQNISASGMISVYPNPNNGSFNVEINSNVEDVQMIILNSLGQTVMAQPLKEGMNVINANTIAKGIYQYIIIGNNYPASNGKLVIE
jgi:hypothetical protein